MGWLESWLHDLEPAKPLPAAVAKPAQPRQPKPDIKTVWITTAPPRDGDAGAAECGFYSVADDMVTMHDETGKAGISRRLAPGDDPHQIAGRLARDAWVKATGTSNFNRRLNYSGGGYA